MAEQSNISWTDSTFNPWIGCTVVGPGCEHCYARDMMQDRYGRVVWGAGQPRVRTKTWSQPLKWEREHAAFYAEHGRRRRVFCASLADFADNEVPDEWRRDLWDLWRATPHLLWLPVTKRLGNVMKLYPEFGSLPNVGIMGTMVTQEEWDRDIGKLMSIPAPWRGVSVEPMLGPIDIDPIDIDHQWGLPDWIITGFESGKNRRPGDEAWVRWMRDQCMNRGITYHHKQNGGLRGKDNGCLIDGEEHKHFPRALAS